MTTNTLRSNLAGFTGTSAGGGLLIVSSDFYLAHNAVLSNTAVFTAAGGPSLSTFGLGGGVAIGSSNGQLANNRIESNVALRRGNHGFGGGIYLVREGGEESSYEVLFEGNLIRDNVGAVYPVDGSGEGGGIWIDASSSDSSAPPLRATMTNNVIQENVGAVSGQTGLGGGVVILNNTIFTFTHNAVLSNTAIISGYSGGVAGLGTSHVTGTLVHNRFIGNNVVINDNHANEAGAAIWIGSADVTLLHPTIARNRGDNAIYLQAKDKIHSPSTLVVTNALFVSHTTGIVVGDHNRATIEGLLWYDTPTAVSYGPLAQVSIAHQVFGDPLFAPDGYHITAGSAAMGRGVPTELMTDVDGEVRPSHPALGADEYWAGHFFLPVISR